ncbi:ABC transporter substrate-binding protein [Kineococcus sp. SYSU DK004]|uniref:ABC transporter substrate-binding protein n=1 Tax=Kineococcus sp. SYSU DK004 TaxID=3383125 RepID=UPI003D7CAE6C
MDRPRTRALIAAAALAALPLSACSAGSLGSSAEEGVTGITLMVSNAADTVEAAEAIAAAFEAENSDVDVTVETRPGGTEGDNLIKTRLATGDMPDVFVYNTGSLLQALNPQQQLVDLSGEAWVGDIDQAFLDAAGGDDATYGAPFGGVQAGAVLYNKAVYEELGLEVPRTWDEFMANSQAAVDSGRAGIIQTYGETWTSQLFVLGDFHNVLAAEPDFPERYTANEVGYATSDAARKGFEHQQQAFEAGLFNENFPSATYPDGLAMLAEGEGVHFPILTGVVSELVDTYPDQVDDIGVFGLPGDDAASAGLTVWTPDGAYIPATTEGERLDAAKRLVAFIASPGACEARNEVAPPTGPYPIQGCELPDDAPAASQDIATYLSEDRATPALEFLSPVKGPNLENLTVEVGSGIRPADDAARLYDEDVAKQAQQLGLEGW